MTAEETIYNTARSGSPVNPGLPPALAYLLVAQSKHETGNYSSNFFKKYNNAFGYSYVPGGRYQSGSGSVADNGQPIAAYPTLENSVYEMIDWIYRRRSEGKFPQDLSQVTTPEQYAQLLKDSGYYGDSLANYLAGLKRFFLNNQVVVAGGGALLVLVAIALLFRFKK